MTNYLKRLVYVDAEGKQKITPLFYPFLFSTFFYGLGFAAAGHWSGVYTSSLFTAMTNLHPWLPLFWGLAALTACVLASILILGRKWPWMGEYAAMFGFLVWLFAGFVYLLNGYWLVLLTVAIPNTFFWCFYYVRVKWYERQKKAGLLVDAG